MYAAMFAGQPLKQSFAAFAGNPDNANREKFAF
jgi:hypothetical protein